MQTEKYIFVETFRWIIGLKKFTQNRIEIQRFEILWNFEKYYKFLTEMNIKAALSSWKHKNEIGTTEFKTISGWIEI